ncbi:MAG: hypothetical protein ACHP7I_05370 [Terriglobales bacterium]
MATSAPQSDSTAQPARAASPAIAILAVLLLALALRVGLALAYPTVDWPDEIFQTTEPAHRLAFGNGVVTWEWRDGVRNWALPGLLAMIMRTTSWMGAGSFGYLLGITLKLATVALAVVWFGYRWGSRVLGARAGVLVAIICAVWYDLVYYGPKPLNEVLAAHLLVAGLYLGYWAEPRSRPARLLVAGVLLGAVVGLRLQLAPAVAVALVFICYRLPRRRWTPILASAAVVFAAFGALDAITWGSPFASYVRSLRVNLVQARSMQYGVFPWNYYWGYLIMRAGWLLPFSLWGARRSPVLAAVAAAVLVTHSAVAHKEYRFIYPAVVLLVMLAGLGIADLIARWQKSSQPSARAVAIAALVVAALSACTWTTAQMSSKYNGALPAFRRLSVDSSVCGVGLRGYWFWSGGYTNLHRNVPIVPVKDDAAVAASSAAFNVLVTIDGVPGHPAGFGLERCWGHACIYRRAGGCLPDPAGEINAFLRAKGQ